jgi:putative heme-binding domain-containing protein
MRGFRIVALAALMLFIATGARAAIEPWADPNLPAKEGMLLWLDAAQQPAAWSAHQKTLADGQAVDVVYDASGNARDFSQSAADAQPHFRTADGQPVIRFDGKKDHLKNSADAPPLNECTIVLVAAPRSNAGEFRAFFASADPGKNDFQTGLTIDQDAGSTDVFSGFDQLNVEGKGFGGARNMLDGLTPFEQMQAIAITMASSGEDAIKVYAGGKLAGKRAREAAPISLHDLFLGARFYGLNTPPAVKGFLDGDIAELLIYNRVLSSEELVALNTYLQKKRPDVVESFAHSSDQVGKPLNPIDNPPDVQMFVPGFAVRKLPLDLTNINNVRYRADGKLVALAYDGNIYVLSDTDGDGLEDKADLFWDAKGGIVAPIGMALTPPGYPRGQGAFVASKGKCSLIVDTDGDGKADKEIIVADGWKQTFHQIDAVGVALDSANNVYFGLGCWNFADPYLKDDKGASHYDIKSERGTILKVAPDFSHREIVCTGVRFSVGLAFNGAGDLFATDQEGATWCPNGNPLDELLHIQPGRHYGFPPRHPVMLPRVIDEPSTFDYAPQHQSTCGLCFDEPVSGATENGKTFGPDAWRGDALVCGSSRGKLYRTKLFKSADGYVAQNQIIGSLTMLTIDSCVSPAGDLVVCVHSGEPDWGSGPTGKGRLYKISYRDKAQPQPVLCYPIGPGELRIAYDRPLDPAAHAGLAKTVSIDFGRYIGAGDAFEKIRPGYAVVKRQQRQPRHNLAISSVQFTRDHRTLVIGTEPQRQAASYAITLPTSRPATQPATTPPNEIVQRDRIDLAYELTGVQAQFTPTGALSPTWTGWLPHPDLAVSRAFTTGSSEHEALWPLLRTPGKLTMRTSLDLRNMLRPMVQPGSRLDYTPAAETVTLAFKSNQPIDLQIAGKPSASTFTVTQTDAQFVPLEIALTTSAADPSLNVSFATQEDSRPRPMALKRFLLPWAKLATENEDEFAPPEPIPQLAGGDWLRGRDLFFGNVASCSKCHQVHGKGSDIGPDLSNLVHRDYESVMRDIRDPSSALNPDYIASTVAMKDGRVFGGIVRGAGPDHFIVRGDAAGEKVPLASSDVKKISPSPISLMPTGLPDALGPEKMRDLLTFLMTEPVLPATLERKGAPPPRTRADVDAVINAGVATTSSTQPASPKSLNILLVAGPKDHGPSEHDYPLWQKRWATLLGLADGVTVDQSTDWPTAAQWSAANVAVFYTANAGWTAAKAKDIDAFLARGGGLVLLHYAVNGRADVQAWADRIGLAWRDGASRFRHGPIDLAIRDTGHPITRGFDHIHFVDESYWELIGDPKRIHLLADAPEENQPRPLLWTVEPPTGGRVFVSVPGHFTWTFDDPLFRLLVLRGVSWSAGEPADRLSGLATIGARVRN